MMNYYFEDCQFEFLNWLRGNNTLHGERDVWRLNSYSINCNDYLTEHSSDAQLLGVIRDETYDVKGRTRAKYFHHLVAPSSKFVPLPFDTEDYSCAMPRIKEKFREACVQTKYRESSAQTSPFEPEFIPDEEGKYLNLEIYSICRAIKDIEEPAEYEVTLIERLKRRRTLEKILHTSKGKKDLDGYRRIIETFEWEEWVAREEDIQYYQNLRLQMVRQLLEEKNHRMRNISDEKVLYRIEKIKMKCENDMSKIQAKYNRDMRKLEYKRKNINRRYQKTDIILEHTAMDSELYAPQMRYGVHPKRKHFVGYKTKFDLRMENLEQKMTKPTVIQCPFAYINEMAKPKKPPKEFTTSFLTDKRLKTLYESLKYFRMKLQPKREAPKCLVKKRTFSKDQIHTTIFGIEQDIQAEEEYQNCIFLQKLIKGRAIQSILYTGKEEFKGLIHEIDSGHSLRGVEALFPDQSTEKESKKAQILAKQKYSELVINNDKNLKTLLRDFEGSVIGPLFEFLEKELDRLYEQKRVQAIVMLAERERYKREAKEAGTRQCENRLRERYVETYTHMVKTTKDNITTYLEDVILEEINMKASVDCHHKIVDIARDLDKFSEEMIEKTTLNTIEKKNNEEKLLKDIVENFLFSSVHNQLARQKLYVKRKKHINAIHQTLYAEYRVAQDVLDEILNDLITNIVQCQSPDEIQSESLKQYIKNIIKDVFEDSINDSYQSVQQIIEYIMNTIFSSEHYSLYLESREKKAFVINVIIKELKEEIGYEVSPEDEAQSRCYLDE